MCACSLVLCVSDTCSAHVQCVFLMDSSFLFTCTSVVFEKQFLSSLIMIPRCEGILDSEIKRLEQSRHNFWDTWIPSRVWEKSSLRAMSTFPNHVTTPPPKLNMTPTPHPQQKKCATFQRPGILWAFEQRCIRQLEFTVGVKSPKERRHRLVTRVGHNNKGSTMFCLSQEIPTIQSTPQERRRFRFHQRVTWYKIWVMWIC